MHIALGRRGEEIAAAYLEKVGYQLVAANFSIPVGRNRSGALINAEIDLVGYDGPILCFVEVKTRESDQFAAPTANVDLRKQRQITRAARAYRRLLNVSNDPYRYDVVSIVLPQATECDEYLIGANFTTEETTRGVQIDLLKGFWDERKFRRLANSSL